MGKQLWQHAVTQARHLGARIVLLDADPYAEAFYAATGARKVGEIGSEVDPGRLLPLMQFEL